MAKYSDLRVKISEWAYMIRLRATLGEAEVDVEDEDDERRLCGVSVSGEFGTESRGAVSSPRSRQTN